MKIIKKIFLTVLISILTLTVFSQPKGFTKVIDRNAVSLKLKKVSAETKTIDCDFLQYKHLDILENDIESIGHFSFKASNKVRWQYTKPYNYLIVMNTCKMWIKNDKKIQEYDTKSNKVFKEVNDLMIGMVQGNILDNPDFNSELYTSKDEILAILVPQKPEMKDFLSEIHIFFDIKTFTVSKLKMIEQSGDYTLIKFINRKYNISISDNNFILK